MRHEVHAPRLASAGDLEVLLLVDREIDFDRIHLGNRRKHGGRADQISNLHGRNSRDSRNQRPDSCIPKIEFCLLNSSLARLDGRFRCQLRLPVVVKLTEGDRVSLCLRNIAMDVECGFCQLRFSFRQLRFCLIERSLIRPGIDLEEHLALLNDPTFAVILSDEVSAHLR